LACLGCLDSPVELTGGRLRVRRYRSSATCRRPTSPRRPHRARAAGLRSQCDAALMADGWEACCRARSDYISNRGRSTCMRGRAGARRSAIAVCSCVSTTTADTLCYGFTRVSRVYDIIRGFLKCCSLRCHTYKSCHAATNLPTNRSSRPHWPRVDVRVSAEGFES
jgi:hypothetical protein